MTKLIASAIALSALFLRAAVSPLTSASDYDFVTIVSTNGIKGVVMDTSADYGAMRYEDIAFITEALAERSTLCVASGFATEMTNSRAANVVSPAIVQRQINLDFIDSYVPLENELVTSARVVNENASTNHIQNVYRARLSYWQAEPTNHIETITQIISNRVDVWTNAWKGGNNIYPTDTIQYYTNTVITGTNLLCFAGEFKTWESLYPITTSGQNESMRFKVFDIGKNRTETDLPIYSVQQLTNLYRVVRAIRRTRPTIPGMSQTNRNNAVRIIETDYNYHSTNRTTAAIWRISNSQSALWTHTQIQNSQGEWEDSYGPTNTVGWNTDVTTLDTLSYALSGHETSADTLGTDTPRIYKAHAFAVVHLWRQESTTATATGAEIKTEVTNTTVEVLVPVSVTKDATGSRIVWHCDIASPSAFFQSAASAAGFSIPTSGSFASLPAALTPEWVYTEYTSNTERSKEHSEYSNLQFEAYIARFLIVYDLKPKTRLSTWSEYNE